MRWGGGENNGNTIRTNTTISHSVNVFLQWVITSLMLFERLAY
jgi:hypothetical protein